MDARVIEKLLIANRGDNRSEAEVAAQGHVGAADVSRSHIAWRAKRAAIEPRAAA
jgi:hypothetical protein